MKKLGAKNIAEATRRAFEIGLLTMIMLMLTFTPINADNHIDIYCNNGEHHGLADNTGVEISFSKNDNNEWILVAGIALSPLIAAKALRQRADNPCLLVALPVPIQSLFAP